MVRIGLNKRRTYSDLLRYNRLSSKKELESLKSYLSILLSEMNPEEAIVEIEDAKESARKSLKEDPTISLPTEKLSRILEQQTRVENELRKQLDSCRKKIGTWELYSNDYTEKFDTLRALREIEQEHLIALESQRELNSLLRRRLINFLLEIMKDHERLSLAQVRNLYVAADMTLQSAKERNSSAHDVEVFEDCVRSCREAMKQKQQI